MTNGGCLADINLLLAAGWDTHPRHVEARKWLLSTEGIYSCDITELGFIRISMSQAFKSTMNEAIGFLRELKRAGIISEGGIACGVLEIPTVTSYKDTTDSYLVHLASANGLALATLDQPLLGKKWAAGIAFDPLQ